MGGDIICRHLTPTGDSEDEYVSAEEGDIGYAGPVTRRKARSYSMWMLPPKPIGYYWYILMMRHPFIQSLWSPKKHRVNKFVAICREFWNKLCQ